MLPYQRFANKREEKDLIEELVYTYVEWQAPPCYQSVQQSPWIAEATQIIASQFLGGKKKCLRIQLSTSRRMTNNLQSRRFLHSQQLLWR